MPSRSEAFSLYLRDIYRQYDRLLGDGVSERSVSHTMITGTAGRWIEPEDEGAGNSVADIQISDFGSLGDLEMGGDIAAMTFVVLMEATQSAQDDLKAIMDETKAALQAKARLRGQINSLSQRIADADEPPHHRQEHSQRETHPFSQGWDCDQTDADLTIQMLLVTAAQQSNREVEARASEFSALRERIRFTQAHENPADLEALEELGELEALRLQMLLDRRAKLMEALSNILKKMHETQEAVIQNLK